MSFINTVDVLGDNVVADSIINGTITEFRDDNVNKIGVGVFYNCKKLILVDVPNVTSIESVACFGASKLHTLILRANSVCTLANTVGLYDTPMYYGNGGIYVPDNLVDQYKSATNWSTFANTIKPLSELEE